MIPTGFLAPFAQTRYFLRAIGLEVVNTIFRRKQDCEPSKPALRRSRWIALSRCTIHILPCGIFLFLIPLNYSVMYIGPGFAWARSNSLYLALFQVAAKALEIICVASLTTVVMHVLRHELMRDGIPLALVGSGVYFSQVSCFWSPEMVASLLYCFPGPKGLNLTRLKKLSLLIIVGLAAFVALLIAPSAAILLQPQTQHVPAGGTEYFIPATSDQLWPSVLDGFDELPECFTEAKLQHIACASGGLYSLRNYFRNFNATMRLPLTMWDHHGQTLSPLIIQSLAARVPRLVNSGRLLSLGRETLMSQPNAITAIFQDSLTEDWVDIVKRWSGRRFASANQYKYAWQRLSIVLTNNPIVHVRCSLAQNISKGESRVDFPVKSWVERSLAADEPGSTMWEEKTAASHFLSLQRDHSEHLRVEWIQLPIETFGPISGAVVLQYPWEPAQNSRAVVGCSISALWSNTTISSDSSANEAAYYFYEPFGNVGSLTSTGKIEIRNDLNASSPNAYRFHRLISIHDRWFRTLAPLTADESTDNYNQSLNTIERLFSDVGLASELIRQRTQPQLIYNSQQESCNFEPPDVLKTDTDKLNDVTCGNGAKRILTELILGATFANGISRYGSHRAFEPESLSRDNPFQWELKRLPKAPNFDASLLSLKPRHNAILPAPAHSNFVTLRMSVEVIGYAWYASSISYHLTTAIVVLYMLMVMSYTVWVVLWTGVTSSSWDTVTELLALALQSPIPQTLKGSGSGVERMSTYKKIIRVTALQREDERQANVPPQLVLVVDDSSTDYVVEEGRRVGVSNMRLVKSICKI